MTRRIHIMGTSGSGKTHLARALSKSLDVPHVELDALYHGPGWTPAEPAAFRAAVQRVTEGDAWIVDGNYSAVRDVLWERADVVLFLDMPRRRVMAQLLTRSLGRRIFRTRLWNGNRERVWDLLRLDPHENVLLWSWSRYEPDRADFRKASTHPRWSHMRFVQVHSVAQALRAVQR